MLKHMNRTTIFLNNHLKNKLKKAAQESGTTMTDLIQNFVREGLERFKSPKKKVDFQIPTFSMGTSRVDISDREELWDIMDES